MVRRAMRASLDTARARLRRAAEPDLPVYCARIYANAAVMRMLPGGRPLSPTEAMPRARANLIGQWESHGFGPWLVECGQDGRLLGHCGLRPWPDSDDVEVLYALEPSAWGRGLATELARASIEAGFADLGLERIVAGAMVDNEASMAVLRKLGMREYEQRSFAGMAVRMFELTRVAATP